MQTPNIKLYIGISFALIILFTLILVISFSKKSINNQRQVINNLPTPTSIESSQQSTINSNSISAEFTGVSEEVLPDQVVEASLQKKSLRQKTPLDFTTFTVDFDYSEDKFTVALKDPKDLSQKVFESWKTNNYPSLNSDQFLLK